MKTFEAYQSLIYKKAHEYKNRNPLWDFDELVAEGALIYVKCTKSYDKFRENGSTFITWLCNQLDYHFLKLTAGKKCNKRGRKPAGGEYGTSVKSKTNLSETLDESIYYPPMSVFDILPPDTLRVIRIMIKEKPENLKAFKVILLEKGWKWSKIRKTFTSIKNSLEEIRWKS